MWGWGFKTIPQYCRKERSWLGLRARAPKLYSELDKISERESISLLEVRTAKWGNVKTLTLSPQASPTVHNSQQIIPVIWCQTTTKLNSKRTHWSFIAVSLPALGKDRSTDYRAEILWQLTRKEKHININELRDCAGSGWAARICLCVFFRVIPCGAEKHINRIPPKSRDNPVKSSVYVQEPSKGGCSKGGFRRVERHAQGNKNTQGY